MKIGIANDLPSAVEALRRALARKPQHELVWMAADGIEAVEMCAKRTPDLVLMDLNMPRMDGVEATRRIMTASPCAILVVTSCVATNSRLVFDAMGHGALDAVDTPHLSVEDNDSALPLLAKIDRIARLLKSGANAGASGRDAHEVAAPQENGLVALGASAGGPAALATLLGALPRTFPAAIVVVQHVDERFAVGLASWLNEQSQLPVRLAREGDRAAPGLVLLAATKENLTFKRSGRLGYEAASNDDAYHPSVDVFFNSVARAWNGPAVGVLLTGMGRDGASGLKALRELGCHTIAQDEGSSAVFGMPKAAARIGAAVEILSLERIAPRLAHLFSADGKLAVLAKRRAILQPLRR